MTSSSIHVPSGIQLLLVEDNPVSAAAVREILSEGRPRFAVRHVETLADAIESLREGQIEVVLLDLGLPDSSGLGTLDSARAAAPEVPIVVLTGVEYEEMALAALSQGADDYLFKGEFGRPLLVRSVRYSMERRQILNDLERTHHRVALRRELETTRAILQRVARLDEGHPALAVRDPESFTAIVEGYGALVAMGAGDSPSSEVAALARQLVAADGSTRDLLQVHAEAMRDLGDLAEARGIEQGIEAGRILVVDLLGHFAAQWEFPPTSTGGAP